MNQLLHRVSVTKSASALIGSNKKPECISERTASAMRFISICDIRFSSESSGGLDACHTTV